MSILVSKGTRRQAEAWDPCVQIRLQRNRKKDMKSMCPCWSPKEHRQKRAWNPCVQICLQRNTETENGIESLCPDLSPKEHRDRKRAWNPCVQICLQRNKAWQSSDPIMVVMSSVCQRTGYRSVSRQFYFQRFEYQLTELLLFFLLLSTSSLSASFHNKLW